MIIHSLATQVSLHLPWSAYEQMAKVLYIIIQNLASLDNLPFSEMVQKWGKKVGQDVKCFYVGIPSLHLAPAVPRRSLVMFGSG